jgi:CubicO group peptidase (beta-lactamase class C family)
MEPQRLGFTPTPVESRLPAAETQDWPMGDRLTSPHHGSSVDRQALSSAVDVAFEDPAAFTAAVAVVHHGELVAERYRQGLDLSTQLESWSMGKSLTATLVGVLIQQGLLSLDQPAPVKEWQHEGDPRAAITIRDLLQMSGGLRSPVRMTRGATGAWASRTTCTSTPTPSTPSSSRSTRSQSFRPAQSAGISTATRSRLATSSSRR